jgi:hypothetical protein
MRDAACRRSATVGTLRDLASDMRRVHPPFPAHRKVIADDIVGIAIGWEVWMSSSIKLRDVGTLPSGRFAYDAAIEWEELRSLRASLPARMPRAGGASATMTRTPAALPIDSGAAWTNTMPATFDPIVNSGPFRETIDGLATREVVEPDVFRHFFAAAVVG